jgi:tetratricopeptide (TPR) repeat protein
MLRRLDEAEADIDQALAIDPRCLPARMNRGVLRVIQNRPADAAAEFDALIASQNPPPEAIYYRAQLFLSAGDSTRAGASLDRLLRDFPEFTPARLLRAKIRLTLAQTREASADLDAYLAAESAMTSVVDPRVVRGHLLRLIAAELPKGGRGPALELAAAELSAAIRDNPTTPPEAHADLGVVLHLQGRLTPALESYARAIALAPGTAQLYVNRGWSLDAANRLADAEADFRKALALSPDHAEATAGLAYVLARQGQRDEAQQRASLALLTDPNEYRVLHNVACVYAALSTTDATRATTHQDAAIRLLERAITLWRAGWGGPDEMELIRDEPAFPQSMRQREDFKRLLQPSQPTSVSSSR